MHIYSKSDFWYFSLVKSLKYIVVSLVKNDKQFNKDLVDKNKDYIFFAKFRSEQCSWVGLVNTWLTN